MSDVMLHGVLKMPIDCWINEDFDKLQRRARYVEASELIIDQQTKIAELENQLAEGEALIIELVEALKGQHKPIN